MLNKEDVKEMKKYFNECITRDGIFEEDFTLNFIKIAKEYIDELEAKLYLCTPEIPQHNHKECISYVDLIEKNVKLEKQINKLKSREQKLIEILEEELTVDNLTVKANKIEKILYGDRISIIKEQAIRATNEYRKEILKILKEKK